MYDDPLLPYSEDDLALLYPNAQLAANTEFIERFIKVLVVTFGYFNWLLNYTSDYLFYFIGKSTK